LSPPIGAAREIAYSETEDSLPPGSALVLYTDGLVERRGEPIDDGLGRLAEAAADSPGHAPTLAGRLVWAMPDTARPDDVAVLVLARREAAGEPFVLRLPAEATSLGPLRDRLRRWLDAAGVDRREAADVLLAVGEAASNAVEHPLEPDPAAIVVSLRHAADGAATIEIRDHGRWDDAPSAPHRGRGMQIMRAIAGDVAVDRSPQGTTVTIHHRRGDRSA
jgi:anti-sigma regulatory factor (Ser/Thr protein kinase)